jgi:hypothetical protein
VFRRNEFSLCCRSPRDALHDTNAGHDDQDRSQRCGVLHIGGTLEASPVLGLSPACPRGARRGSEGTAPDFPETGWVESGCASPLSLLAFIRRFHVPRGDIPDGLQQPAVIEPDDPVRRDMLDGLQVTPRTPVVNYLGLVEADDRLRRVIILGVSRAAHRGHGPASARRSV